MKYLKRFNESYNPQEVLYDLEDMVTDLDQVNITAQVLPHFNIRIGLGDIVTFKREHTEEYKDGDYTFNTTDEYKVCQYENSKNYFIKNITTNDGYEFISRDSIRMLIKKKYKTEYQITIFREGDSSTWVRWGEIKDTIIRITEYCYDNNLLISFAANGRTTFDGYKSEEDFRNVSDDTTFGIFRMAIHKQ